MKSNSAKSILGAVLCAGLSSTGLHAANDFFSTGDLILYFQKPGDDDTVYVSLGSAANLYRGPATGPTADRQELNIVNISSVLAAAFGPSWASDPNLYAGVAGCRSNSGGLTVTEGDHGRTIYMGRPRTEVGSPGAPNSAPWNLVQANSSTAGATDIVAMGNNLENNTTQKAQAVGVATSVIDNLNPFLVPGIQRTAFSAFAGGVQQVGSLDAFGTFGPAGSVEFALDLNRITAREDSETNGVEVPGVKQIGSYEGTIVVGTDGNVSFITQGAAVSSAFATWISGSNPPLTNASDKLANADPDLDGYSNLTEFVLNGNPAVSGQSIAPTIAVSATDFVFSFNRRDDSETEAPATFQYSTDLTNWTDVTVGASSGAAGAATLTLTVTENSNAADAISISVPKTVAPGGKLFGRLKATQP